LLLLLLLLNYLQIWAKVTKLLSYWIIT